LDEVFFILPIQNSEEPNYSTLNFADPDSEDIGQYNQILKEAKDALQELEDINWLPTS